MKVDLNKQHLIALVSKEMPFDMEQCGHYERQGMMKFTGNQWNEKWEWNYEYLVNIPELGLVSLYNSLCKVENRLIVFSVGNDADQLRQQLAAEQAKSADVLQEYYARDREVTKYLNKCVEINELARKHFSDAVEWREKAESAEATIAAMHSALESIVSMVTDLAEDANDTEGEILCLAMEALSNTAGGEYSRVKKLEDIVRSVEWSGESQRYCEETGGHAYFSCCLMCGGRLIDGHYKDCPVKAVLGEGEV